MSVLFAEREAKEEKAVKVRSKYFRDMRIEYVRSRGAYDRVIREYQNAEKIYFDLETTGLDPLVEGRIWLATMCLPGSNIVHVIDAQHCELIWLRDILEHTILVGANIGFDLKWLRKYGIRPRRVKDVIIQSRMLSAGIKEHKNDLNSQCKRYFGIELAKDVTKQFITHPEALRRMIKPREFTKEQILYAAEDVYVLEDIEKRQAAEIRREELEAVADLENSVVPVAADMEYDGIYVDEDDWMKLVFHSEEEKKRLYGEVANDLATDGTQTSLFPGITGSDYIINLNSGNDVKVRLAARGIDVPNLDKDELLQFYQQFRDPVIKRYVNFKMLDKRVGTYGKDWIARKHPVTGRIHTSLNQLVDTGRFSGRDPNTMNVPDNKHNMFLLGDPRWDDPTLNPYKLVYDPTLPDLSYRHCFKPRKGYVYVDSDYSQMELRILAEISGDPALIEIFVSGQDMHAATAAKMFGIPIEEVTKEQRSRGKTINFAIAYGKGPTTLAEDFNLFYELKAEYQEKLKNKQLRKMPSDEQIQKEAVEKAQGFLDAYFKAFPLVKAWLDWAAEQPFETGYSLTLLGRKRYFTPVDREKKDKKEARRIEAGMRNQGKNSPIQGANADITKMAMVRIAQKIFNDGWDAMIVNVIHDEFLVEVREDQAEAVMKIVETEMINAALELMHKVPVKADPVIVGRWEKA